MQLVPQDFCGSVLALSLGDKDQSSSHPVSCCFSFPKPLIPCSLGKSLSRHGIRSTLGMLKCRFRGSRSAYSESQGLSPSSCFIKDKHVFSAYGPGPNWETCLRVTSPCNFLLHLPSSYLSFFKVLLLKTGQNSHIKDSEFT